MAAQRRGDSVSNGPLIFDLVFSYLPSSHIILYDFQIVKRWMPDKFAKNPKKKGEHRAMGDILESIEELKWYKENVFLPH